MRPNSISLLIIQLFHLISNCTTVRCVHRCKGAFKANLYLQRQHTEDIFPLSSLSAEADLWPVCVFTLETPTRVLRTQSNRENKRRWWGCFLMTHRSLTFVSLEDYKKGQRFFFSFIAFSAPPHFGDRYFITEVQLNQFVMAKFRVNPCQICRTFL